MLNVCFPKNAKNVEAAHMYINFLTEKQVAYENAKFTEYATANLAALELLPDEIKNDKRVYPNKEEIKVMVEHISNLDNNSGILMETLWNNLISEDNETNFDMILLCIIILTTSILLIIELYSMYKAKCKKLENSVSSRRRTV
ncbi:PotD/PotF family extracellular solute-binding protein [Brachyspira pulli]|uniref:PotD/PotF family extracellular solute-binding protein n=1 Tax=Brachyspira pulli TaxID=310721 RepID=UPI003006F039